MQSAPPTPAADSAVLLDDRIAHLQAELEHERAEVARARADGADGADALAALREELTAAQQRAGTADSRWALLWRRGIVVAATPRTCTCI